MSQEFKGPKYNVKYDEYLHLEALLRAQEPESRKVGREAHDETLFIVVHQTYELWFKQILHELESVMAFFGEQKLKDEALGVCVTRLDRITRIQKVMLEQIGILETMTPMDFLDFRDLLYPASGFQSFQFRMIENELGLKKEERLPYDHQSYLNRIGEAHRKAVVESEIRPSLFALIEAWLERTPFVQAEKFSFWQEYRGAVGQMLAHDEEGIRQNPFLNEEGKSKQLEQLQKTRESFEMLHDARRFQEAIDQKRWRLSHKATLAALFVYLYRDEPALQLPYKLLSLVTDIDENFTHWRYRHSQMALRMIGTKIGTGGSSGSDYLSRAMQAHRIFHDFTRLATFLIPRRLLPELPKNVKDLLSFHYQRI